MHCICLTWILEVPSSLFSCSCPRSEWILQSEEWTVGCDACGNAASLWMNFMDTWWMLVYIWHFEWIAHLASDSRMWQRFYGYPATTTGGPSASSPSQLYWVTVESSVMTAPPLLLWCIGCGQGTKGWERLGKMNKPEWDIIMRDGRSCSGSWVKYLVTPYETI